MSQKDIQLLKTEVKTLKKEITKLYRKKCAPNYEGITTEEVAEWIGCSVETVKKYEKQGFLVPTWPNAKKRFHFQDVEHFLRGYMPSRRLRKKS